MNLGFLSCDPGDELAGISHLATVKPNPDFRWLSLEYSGAGELPDIIGTPCLKHGQAEIVTPGGMNSGLFSAGNIQAL